MWVLVAPPSKTYFSSMYDEKRGKLIKVHDLGGWIQQKCFYQHVICVLICLFLENFLKNSLQLSHVDG